MKTFGQDQDFSEKLINLFTSEYDLETIHSAKSNDCNFIKITEKCLNIFKTQIIILAAEHESRTTNILYKKKVRHIVKSNRDPKNLLKLMPEVIPEKGDVAIYCEDLSLYVKFQENYRQFFSDNINLKILKSPTLLEDITDKVKILRKVLPYVKWTYLIL